jgi:large subunit ribosomal protein L13
MKIINGKGQILGRLASYVAKESLKGEDIAILNSEEIVISGNKKTTEREFLEQRDRVGHSQKGPKHHATTIKVVKRTIRGMLPNFRIGRGSDAFKRIKCHIGIPKEFEGKPIINLPTPKKIKIYKVREFVKK